MIPIQSPFNHPSITIKSHKIHTKPSKIHLKPSKNHVKSIENHHFSRGFVPFPALSLSVSPWPPARPGLLRLGARSTDQAGQAQTGAHHQHATTLEEAWTSDHPMMGWWWGFDLYLWFMIYYDLFWFIMMGLIGIWWDLIGWWCGFHRDLNVLYYGLWYQIQGYLLWFTYQWYIIIIGDDDRDLIGMMMGFRGLWITIMGMVMVTTIMIMVILFLLYDLNVLYYGLWVYYDLLWLW